MEMNRSALERPQQLAWNTSGHVRLYRCTFCRRDFSNAQALGGHMNIHRRDRAKLKGSSDETLFSRDNDFKKNDTFSPPKASSNHDSMQDISGENGIANYTKSCAHKRTLSLSEEDEESPANKYRYKDVRQLPFFVEKSYATNDFGTKSFCGGRVEKKHGSSSLELDLELRLGPVPQD